MFYAIEHATRQKIEPLELPSTERVNNKRIADFKQKITDTLAAGELAFMQGLVEQYQQEHDVPARAIAAALAQLSLGGKSLLLEDERGRGRAEHKRERRDGDKPPQSKPPPAGDGSNTPRERRPRRAPAPDTERFRLAVGSDHGVQPGNIVGAIANEAGLDAEHIGHIEIHADHSLVDLPSGMPREVFRDLKKAWVCGQQLRIVRVGEPGRGATETRDAAPKAARTGAKPRPPAEPRKGRGKAQGEAADKGKPRGKSKARAKARAQPAKKPRG